MATPLSDLNVVDVLTDEAQRICLDAIARDGEVATAQSKWGLFGLALSGGGIRSATFSLGVLQALAQRGYLACFDFLSTVSGGGYIGSWLSAWIHRTDLSYVQQQLGKSGTPSGGDGDEPEPYEVNWLRRYSNYLTPRLGLLSADTLALFATWLRNVILNLIVIVAAIVALLLAGREIVALLRFLAPYYAASGALGVSFLAIALVALSMNFSRSQRSFSPALEWVFEPVGILCFVLLPVVLAAFCGAVYFIGVPEFTPQYVLQSAIAVAGVLFGVFIIGFVMLLWDRSHDAAGHWQPPVIPPDERWAFLRATVIYLIASVIAFGSLFLLASGTWQWVHGWHEGAPLALVFEHASLVQVATFILPALILAMSLGTTLFTGIVGNLYEERTREWWSRFNAWLAGAALAWFAWMALTLYAPPLIAWAGARLPGWLNAALGSAWLGALLSALFVRVPKQSTPRTQRWLSALLNFCAWLVVAGFLIMIAVGVDRVLAALSEAPVAGPATVAMRTDQPASWLAYFGAADQRLFHQLATRIDLPWAAVPDIGLVELALLAALVTLALFGWRVDVNRFSIHNMYRLRLARCYLGASNAQRNPHPFTGFDESDDLPLAHLEARTANGPLQRPYHIINAALNITQGQNLAWQERKAAAFIFTPLVCGYALSATAGQRSAPGGPPVSAIRGYCDTAEYGSEDSDFLGIGLSTALATSGAAVSPNQGFHSAPARAFLLTIFNVRLGRWAPNPAKRRVRSRAGPRFGLLCLLQELFGFSNDERDYIYLSDGGHFDNMGLYELVRRRCRVIVVADAAADPELQFRDLGDAIRKCRIDFGVDIEVPLDALRTRNPPRTSIDAFTLGRIRYDPGDRSRDGVLIVVRPARSLAVDARAADVNAYAARNPQFPQQSTADQFYDESQFESYRKLGQVTTLQMLDRYQAQAAPIFPPAPAIPPPAPPPGDAPEPVPLHRLRNLWKATLWALAMWVLLVISQWVLGQSPMECVRLAAGTGDPSGCAAATAQMVAADVATWRYYGKMIWLFADLAFAAYYCGLLIFAARYGASTVRGVAPLRWRGLVHWVAFVVPAALAVLAAVLDAWENALMFAELTHQATRGAGIAGIVAVTVWKFQAFAAAIVAIVVVGGFALIRWRRLWR